LDFRRTIAELVSQIVKIDESILEIPPDRSMGDFAMPCFTLAKAMKKSPADVAQQLSKDLKLKEPVHKIEVKGPYLNFFLNRSVFAKEVLNDVHDQKEKYGSSTDAKNILVEYPSPNTNKPLHLGHIRNMLLGDSVSRILKFAGNNVIQANLNNDRGVHIC